MTNCLCSTGDNGETITSPQCPTHNTDWARIGSSAYLVPRGTPLPDTFPPPPVRIRKQCGACDGIGKIPTPNETLRECPLCDGTGIQP